MESDKGIYAKGGTAPIIMPTKQILAMNSRKRQPAPGGSRIFVRDDLIAVRGYPVGIIVIEKICLMFFTLTRLHLDEL